MRCFASAWIEGLRIPEDVGADLLLLDVDEPGADVLGELAVVVVRVLLEQRQDLVAELRARTGPRHRRVARRRGGTSGRSASRALPRA